MPKVKVKLTEMTDARAEFISLVDRAASRMPVRVLKSDKEYKMLDLTHPGKLIARILKGEKTEPEVPTITAVVVFDHGEGQAKIEQALKDSGFDITKAVKSEDGTVMYPQSENPTEGARLLRMSDDLLLVVKGFDSMCWPEVGTEFKDAVQAQNFLPGVNTAMNVMYSMASQALYSADSPADAKAKISDVVQKFSTYVTDLAGALPSKAFKADTSVSAVVKQVKTTKAEAAAQSAASAQGEQVEKLERPDHVTESDWNAMDDEAKKSACKTKKGMTKPDHVSQEDWDGMDDEAKEKACKGKTCKAEELPAAQSTAQADGIALLMQSMKELGDKFATVVSKVEAVEQAQKASESRLDNAVKKFDDAAKTLDTVVVAPPSAAVEDTQAQRRTNAVKNDDPRSAPLPANFDTSIHRRRAR